MVYAVSSWWRASRCALQRRPQHREGGDTQQLPCGDLLPASRSADMGRYTCVTRGCELDRKTVSEDSTLRLAGAWIPDRLAHAIGARGSRAFT
jgi:hypothetical protein